MRGHTGKEDGIKEQYAKAQAGWRVIGAERSRERSGSRALASSSVQLGDSQILRIQPDSWAFSK